MSNEPVRLLFVCLGNICRSPLAEGVFRHLARQHGVEEHFEIDSAGTGSWHVGESPDDRMQATAAKNRIDISGQRARQIAPSDLEEYDHIFVMDKSNLADVLALDEVDEYGHRVRLFREFDPAPGDFQVPDPYYGEGDGFDRVYSIVERTARMLLGRLIDEHDLPAEGLSMDDLYEKGS